MFAIGMLHCLRSGSVIKNNNSSLGIVFDQAQEGAQVMHTPHVHLRGTVLRAQKQRLHDAEGLVKDRHVAEHLRARAHRAVSAHVAVLLFPWTTRELVASAAPPIDRPFIVLTETKPIYPHIPVWARYSPHRTRVEAHVNTLSP
jgi:hypothetical protein